MLQTDYSVLALPCLEELLRPPERIGVADWALRYRVLPGKNQAIPGPWQHRAAYLVEIMDSVSTPGIEQVSIMKSPQTGGSEAMLNALAWAMTTRPGPTAYVMPTEDAKKEFVRDRVRPTLQASTHPLLRRWVNPKLWERTRIEMPDMTLFALHAGSATDLASRPIQYVFLDEVDKYKPIPKEGHPEDLAIKRTITFQSRRKIVRVSTPTIETGRIYQAWQAGDMRRWHVQCTKCGTWQVLSRSSIRWPHGASSAQVLRDKSAWVECCHSECKARYDDAGRDELVAAGVWVPEECSIDDDGEIVGYQGGSHRSYHIWAGMSPWVSIHEIASQDIASLGDAELRHDFTNNVLGEPFFELDTQVDLEDLDTSSVETSFRRGVAPSWARIVVLAADMQKGPRIPYLALACGENEQYAVLDWGQLHGQDCFERYESMFRGGEWPTETGELLGVQLAMIDHEGGIYTSIVEDLAASNQDILRLVKGRTIGNTFEIGRVDRRGLRKSEFQGLPLYLLNVDYQKGRAARMLTTERGKRGCIYLPFDVEEELKRHLSSEARVIPQTGKNRTPVWQKKPGHRVNDWWDCLIYALAGSMMLGVHSGALEAQRQRADVEREKKSRDFKDEGRKDRYWQRNQERKKRKGGSYWGRGRR